MKPNESLGHEPSCRSLLIVGAGVMGQGIARLFAAAGIDVTLMDCLDVKISHPAVKFVRETPAASAPDLVIEAVFEDAVVKKSVYAEIERVYGGRPVVATNTSGLPLNDLAGGLKYPERFLAMHFFMPAEVFPMIEVMRRRSDRLFHRYRIPASRLRIFRTWSLGVISAFGAERAFTTGRDATRPKFSARRTNGCGG